MSLGLVQELFSEVGDLKRCSIHYDPSGRSKVHYQLLQWSPSLKVVYKFNYSTG